uniref:Uncharacterized protein n=1 Tax=Oryzias latipes TaxID=8090 RepID=A0A3P9LPF3_ORYLA
MNTSSQIRLLLWKNWTLRKRQKKRFLVEIFWPVLLFVGLVWLRKANPLYQQHECEQPCPQLGSYIQQGESLQAWCPTTTAQLARFYVDIQELLLNQTDIQNYGRLWRELTSFSDFMDVLRRNPSALAGRGLRIEDMLKDDELLTAYLLRDVGLPESLLYQLLNAKLRLEQFAFGVPDLQLKDIACSQALLERFIIFPSRMGLHGVRNAMCALSQQRLQRIEDVLYANLDFFKIFKLVKFLSTTHVQLSAPIQSKWL